MTNSVEICKQLSSLNFINVKLKSKQILNWNFLSVQYTVIVLHIIKGSKFFSIWEGLFLNFRKIVPTISYNLFQLKRNV